MKQIKRPLYPSHWRQVLQNGILSQDGNTGKPLVFTRPLEETDCPVVINMFGAEHGIPLETGKLLSHELNTALQCLQCDVHDDGYNCAVSSDGTCSYTRSLHDNDMAKKTLESGQLVFLFIIAFAAGFALGSMPFWLAP